MACFGMPLEPKGPGTLPGLVGIGRVGAWPTPAVEQVTRLLLLRLRHQLTTHARRERLLLVEV